MTSGSITAVIPAYNESGRIAGTIAAVKPYVDEVLVIDDGSSDDTAEQARANGVRVLLQPHNQGYIAAIKRGFSEAGCNIVVTIDADGELPAGRIPELVRPILEGRADMVQGSRRTPVRPSERVLTWLANLRAPVGDSGTGFRALRTPLARELEIDGACICGILALEVAARGGVIAQIPIELKQVDKPRRIAWYHVRQFFHLLPWLFRTRK